MAATTATALDLTTGEQIWGPVDVPGPYQGPGLVFAAPPEGFMGQTGPRVALDPTTGQVAAAESDILDAAGLHAYDADNQSLWSLSVHDETTITAIGGVFLYVREGGAIRVHNVVTGDVAQAYEPDGQGTIIVPSHITVNGAAVLLEANRELLATIPEHAVTDEVGP